MARNRKGSPAAVPPPDPTPAKAAADRGRKAARVFLMVAGGLAAPCLALAAFFLTSSGSSDKPARPATAHGRVTGTTRSAGAGTTAAPAPTTTTTTTAPAAVGLPPRDPFAPLVNTAPATPGK